MRLNEIICWFFKLKITKFFVNSQYLIIVIRNNVLKIFGPVVKEVIWYEKHLFANDFEVVYEILNL